MTEHPSFLASTNSVSAAAEAAIPDFHVLRECAFESGKALYRVVKIGNDLEKRARVEIGKPRDELPERPARVAEHTVVVRHEIGVGVFDELRGAPHLAFGRGIIPFAVLVGDEAQTFAFGVAAVLFDLAAQKVRNGNHIAHKPRPVGEDVGVEPLQDIAHLSVLPLAGHGVSVVDVSVAVRADVRDASVEKKA